MIKPVYTIGKLVLYPVEHLNSPSWKGIKGWFALMHADYPDRLMLGFKGKDKGIAAMQKLAEQFDFNLFRLDLDYGMVLPMLAEFYTADKENVCIMATRMMRKVKQTGA
jgi:hypothetical protein